jgi:hypothetical protein
LGNLGQPFYSPAFFLFPLTHARELPIAKQKIVFQFTGFADRSGIKKIEDGE